MDGTAHRWSVLLLHSDFLLFMRHLSVRLYALPLLWLRSIVSLWCVGGWDVYSASAGNDDVVRELLGAGADVKAVNDKGLTPLCVTILSHVFQSEQSRT